jgi:hypothetical protein
MSRHRFHGASERFDVVAEFIYDRYGNTIKYIADVAGGQGMLTRVLNKRFNYVCELIDPRGRVMRGVPYQRGEFNPSMAVYYDLIIGLHPDEATRVVAEAASIRPVILIPCCNFWSEEKLGRDALVIAIENYYSTQNVGFERVIFGFSGPKNIGIVSVPPVVS